MRAPAKHPAVDVEIKAAAAWYDERCPGLGDQFIDAVRAMVRSVQRTPLRFAVRFADLRRANLTRFPYAVWFFQRADDVYVLAVLHHKRDHRALLEQRRANDVIKVSLQIRAQNRRIRAATPTLAAALSSPIVICTDLTKILDALEATQEGTRLCGPIKHHGYFPGRDDRNPERLRPMRGEKLAGRPALATLAFAPQIADERGVSDHARRDRRPRPSRNAFSMRGLAGGTPTRSK